MKKNIFLACMLFVAVLFSATDKLNAQSCNQVEILYTAPDCFDRDPHDVNGGAGGQQKGCKEISVCVDQSYTYTSSITGGGWSYNWTVSGPIAVTINPNNTSPSVNISWPQIGVYTLTLTATDPAGNIFSYCLKINVKEKPNAGFTFSPNNVCAGSIITFTGTTTYSGSFMSTWNFGDIPSGSNNYASTSGNTPVTHQYNSPGTYTVTLITYSFVTVTGNQGPQGDSSVSIKTCCADTVTHQVTIKPGTLKIECISTVCPGDTVKYHVVGCAGVTWLPVIGGNAIASTPTTITIVWGNGNPQGQIQATCPGGCTASVPVPIIPTTPIIDGNTSPCNTSTTSYTLPVLPGTFYTWTLTNITTNTNYNNLLNSYPDNNTVWINWQLAPAGSYQLTINLDNKHICCSSSGSLIINPSGKWKAMIDQTICTGPPGANLYTTPGPGTFSWTILPPLFGATPPSFTGPAFNPIFPNPGTYTVQVIETANTYCNSGSTNPQQIKITVLATMPPGIINGPDSVCVGSQHTYTMSTNAPPGYHYAWSITSGAGCFQPLCLPTATGNSVNIQWTTIPATISVVLQANGFPSCPSAPVIKNIYAATLGTITGTMNVCVDGNGYYTLAGGTLPPGEPVTWTIDPPYASLGTVTAGQGSNSITILWHGQPTGGPWGPVTIKATTGCGSKTLTGIMVYPKFSIGITKSGTDICTGGVNLTATGAPGGAAYLWSPGGQTTSFVNGITVPGFYTVTATNPPPTGGGGCVAQATYEVVDPFVIKPTTCGVGRCSGTATTEQLGVIVVKPAVGPFGFQWYNGTYPSGTLIPGATTPTYNTPSHGNFYVIVTYGSCTRFLNYTVKKVCCPDVNNPQIAPPVRNSCNSFTFTGTTPNLTGATITWDFGNGVTMPGTSGSPITYVYPAGTTPGDYCVTFCVGPPSPNTTNCTGNCAVATVRVPLLAAFTYKLGCNGCLAIDNLTMIAPTSGAATTTFNWNFGDATPVVTTTSMTPPAHCYTSPTPATYTITLIVNYSDPSIGLNCSSPATQTVNWVPLAISVVPSPVCTGVQTSFSIAGSPSFTIVNYTWAFGDGFTAYTPTSTHIYNTSGPFNVTLTVVDALGNTCSKTKPITVEAGIGPCTILPGYICPGGSATLTAPNVAGAAYLWQIESAPGVWTAAPGANTGMTYSTTVVGFYHVVITGPAPGFCKCTSNRVEVKAVTKPKAIISVAPSSKLCGPGSVTLTSPNHLPGYTSNWWNFNYTNNFATGMIATTPTIPSTTTIHLVLTNEYGCSDTCSLVITVNSIPTPPTITSSSATMCEGVPITLTESPYLNNILWNTGATTPVITVVSAGTYTVTYTNPTTGCSSSKSILVKRRPSTDLFPRFCDSIPCTCRDSAGNFTIYAPKPLIGTYASNYNIQWFLNGNPVGAPGPNPTYSPAQTGTYHIIIQDLTTGCKDTSLTYSVIVPKCDSCDCKESKWNDIILTEGSLPDNGKMMGSPKIGEASKAVIGTNPIKLKCKNNYTLKCNQSYTFNASFSCKDSLCPPKVTYSLQPPVGLPVTGTVSFSYTFTQNGVYILTLYGWCGNKICDSCVIDLTVKCDPLCDCKESKWGDIIMTKGVMDEKGFLPGPIGNLAGNGPPKKSIEEANSGAQSLKCNNSYAWPCNQPFTINASYKCKDSLHCPPKVTYSLQPPTGLPINGTVAFTYTPVQSGTYILTLYGWCGDKICDSCVIKINVRCDCDCKGSKWGEKMYSVNNTSKPLTCMKAEEKPIDVKCNDVISINANYMCTGANCPGQVTYILNSPSGTSTGSILSPLIFTTNQTGTYTVTLYGWCGTTKCDSCVIRFRAECPPPPCCPYKITVDTSQVTSTYNQQYNATLIGQNFTINGLTGIPLTEVRADVLSYTITDNYNKECMKCVNLPYTWASVQSAGNLGSPSVPPKITMFNSTVHPFNPTGPGVYQNPREVVWNNGSTFIINSGSQVGMNFLLPPPPAIDCCEFKGKICVKFTFRDDNCKECEVIACFEFVMKSKKGF